MNKKRITNNPGVRNLGKVAKDGRCFDYCDGNDYPCDACTSYGEIQPEDEEKN